MSVVAVKVYDNKIVIGADSFVTFGYDTQLKDRDVKIFQNDNIILGCVGYAQDCNLMRIFSRDRKPSDATEESIIDYLVEFTDWCRKRDKDYKLQSAFMIVYLGKVFYTSNMYIKEIKDYRAMGAGQDIAQTALYLGKNVEEALDAATELSQYCEKPINIIEVKK